MRFKVGVNRGVRPLTKVYFRGLFLEQVKLLSAVDRLNTVCYVQLAKDAVGVGFDRASSNDKLVGDLWIG